MTFFKLLFKALAAAGGGALIVILMAINGVFGGPVPSDVSPGVWVLVASLGTLVVNFLISLVKVPAFLLRLFGG